MLPLVAVEIRHGFSAVTTYMNVGVVLPLDVHKKIHFHLEGLAAGVANKLSSSITMRSHMMLLQRYLTFILQVTYIALEEVIIAMALTMLFQVLLGMARCTAFITFIRPFLMARYNMSLQMLLMFKVLQAKRTCGPHFVQHLIHIFFFFVL